MEPRRDKKEYMPPALEDFGEVHELTRDPGKKPVGVIDGPHGPKNGGSGSAAIAP